MFTLLCIMLSSGLQNGCKTTPMRVHLSNNLAFLTIKKEYIALYVTKDRYS